MSRLQLPFTLLYWTLSVFGLSLDHFDLSLKTQLDWRCNNSLNIAGHKLQRQAAYLLLRSTSKVLQQTTGLRTRKNVP
jgi:hypothetical protein